MQVSWDDIAGQETAKRLVQELVVWPMTAPASGSPRTTHTLGAAYLPDTSVQANGACF